jgi:hypothetical protein
MNQPVRLLACGAVLAAGALAATSSGPAHGAPQKDVVVTNPASDPALVRVIGSDENPARQPFQEKKQIVLPDGQCCDNAFVDVPAGKRLVIEYASASGFANGSQWFMYEVGTLVDGQASFTRNHFLPVAQQIDNGNTVAIAGQQVRIYADGGGGRVMLRASRSGGGEATVFMTVSGHLVDVP